MSKWLVIGASSFSGRHFCQFLRKRGEEVMEASLRDSAFPHADRVVNFAALNVVAPSWEWPLDYFRVNVEKQISLWRDLAQLNVPYLHISTPEVYGSTHGFVREDAPYNPSTPYAVSRASAEMMIKAYQKRYNWPAVITRACNVYGPGQQLYRLIPRLIVSIKRGIKFQLEGGGRSMRSFLHIDDACEAYYLAAMQESGIYNISGPNYHSIATIVRMVSEEMGVDWREIITECEERPGKDADYELNDIQIIALGWLPRILLPEGIRSVIEWVDREWEQLKDQPMEYEFRP
jgi:dTDP-glucose 4,6-dehydratase